MLNQFEVLARVWCHKLQFFLDAEQGRPAGRDLSLDHNTFEGYQEPEAFRHLAFEASGPLRRRVQQFRSLLQAE